MAIGPKAHMACIFNKVKTISVRLSAIREGGTHTDSLEMESSEESSDIVAVVQSSG
jgi:hypothetical protein